MLRNPDGLGFADWDFVLDKFEAVRRTILIWRQFPWWNPWCRGGFPLAAEPQIGAVSMATPLVLAMGTAIGLRVAAILCMWIAVEGAYRLAWLWFREPWAAAAAALIYGLNGAVSVGTGRGLHHRHELLQPALAGVPRVPDRRAVVDGVWLGFWLAFTLLNGLQYISLYASSWRRRSGCAPLRVQPRGQRGRLLRNTMAAVGVFLVISGWRLATVYLVLLDDRREAMTLWDESLAADLPPLARPTRHRLARRLAGRHWDWLCLGDQLRRARWSSCWCC